MPIKFSCGRTKDRGCWVKAEDTSIGLSVELKDNNMYGNTQAQLKEICTETLNKMIENKR